MSDNKHGAFEWSCPACLANLAAAVLCLVVLAFDFRTRLRREVKKPAVEVSPAERK